MKHLITGTLPYVNGIKHLGNLAGSLLPPDVYARYLRQKGEEVLFICGTDDFGTPAELGALEENMPIEEYCNKHYLAQKDVYDRFHLTFDFFGRSSSHQNAELTQHFFSKLDVNGFIEEKTLKQFYSIDDARFLPDRYVVGTCPHCNSHGARGDQCENCTALLDPEDLVNPHSAISGSTNLEMRETRHLFLKQSALTQQIADWLNTRNGWSPLVLSIAHQFLKEGLEDRCITRDLKWGVKVNKEGFDDKVFYVWFNAPIGYFSITMEWANQDPDHRDWKDWWFGANEVNYTQFMGKDNVPFHALTFPATLLGSGEQQWKMVDNLKGFNWLTYYGGKFSTSKKRGVFLDQALEEFPADYYRYWLLVNAPEGSDSDFSWDSFAKVVNKDLADVLGNFVMRTTKFIESKYNGVVPSEGNPSGRELALLNDLNVHLAEYSNNLENLEFRKAMRSLRSIWTLGNIYLDDTAPWIHIKESPENAAVSMRTAINLVYLYATLSSPVIPDASAQISQVVSDIAHDWKWPKSLSGENFYKIAGGTRIQVPDVQFKKILPEEVMILEKKYLGEDSLQIDLQSPGSFEPKVGNAVSSDSGMSL